MAGTVGTNPSTLQNLGAGARPAGVTSSGPLPSTPAVATEAGSTTASLPAAENAASNPAESNRVTQTQGNVARQALGLPAQPAAGSSDKSFFQNAKEVVSDTARTVTDGYKTVKSVVVPEPLSQVREANLDNGWKARFQAADVNLRPQWKGGPDLAVRGDALTTSVVKTEQLGGDWSTSQGVRGGLRVETSVQSGPSVDASAQVFKEWKGPVGESCQLELGASAGVRQRLLGQDSGFKASANTRQQLDCFQDDKATVSVSAFAQSQQQASIGLGDSNPNLSYHAIAGPKLTVHPQFPSKKTEVELGIGPQVQGHFNGPGDSAAAEVSPGAQLRVSF